MEIKWFGNTSFLITTSNGRRILLDPAQITPSIENYDLNLDIITFSDIHDKDISNFSINKNIKILNSVCNFENEYISIEGYKTYKDDVNGYKRGENIIYQLKTENYRICHLGSLGHIIDKNLISKIYGCDILLVPIGGHFCLDGITASKLVKQIKPRFVIPMYFKTSLDYFYLDGPYKFLSNMKNVITLNTNKVYLNELKNSKEPTVIIISNKNKEPL